MTTMHMHYQLAQGTGLTGEPVRKTHFELDIPDILDNISLYVNRFTAPEGEIERMEVRHQNGVSYIAGKPSVSEATLVIRDVLDPNTYQAFRDWFKLAWDPTTGKMGFASQYKKRGFCMLNDAQGNVIRTYELIGLWVRKDVLGQFEHGNFDGRELEFPLSCDEVKIS